MSACRFRVATCGTESSNTLGRHAGCAASELVPEPGSATCPKVRSRVRCMPDACHLHCELVLETIGKSGVGHSVCWQQRVDVPRDVKLCTLACVALREEPKYPGRINSESMFRAM